MTTLTPPAPAADASPTPETGLDSTDGKTAGQWSIAEWKAVVADYTAPSVPKAVWQIVNTLVPYALMWPVLYWSLSVSYWLTLGLAVPTGLLLVRAFIIFHDCGHGSFFKSKRANGIVGFITGMLTFTPYGHWTWQHSVHHQTSGDLDRRGDGDIWTLTVKEYQEASTGTKLLYRFVRNPFVMLVLAPLGLFVIYQRFSSKNAKAEARRSVWRMNLALLAMVVGMSWLIGFQNYLLIQIPLTLFSGAAGIWMFYVQHQYEDVYWERRDSWDYTTAALEGSSYFKLPKILQWFTGNIGFHHVHHLSSRVPNYHLEACHNSHPMFRDVPCITLRSSLKCASLRLYDEDSKQLVGFKHLKKAA